MAFRQADRETLRALAILQNSQEWKTVAAYLRAMLADQDKENRSLLSPQLHQGQGRSQLLAHLIELDENALENWRKVRDSRQNVRTAQGAQDGRQLA